MEPLPHRYDVEIEWEGTEVALVTAWPRPPIPGGPPPEFGGKDRWWSPEHLLLSSLGLCFWTTFQAIAAQARVPVVSWQSHVRATLDRTEDGIAFTSFVLHAALLVAPADVARAEQLAEKAKKHCLISAALKAPVELELTVGAAEPATV